LTATGAVLPASFEVANRLAEFASHEAQDLHPRQESTPRWPRPPRQCKHFGCVRAMSLKIMARISFSPLTAHTSSFVLFPLVFFFFLYNKHRLQQQTGPRLFICLLQQGRRV